MRVGPGEIRPPEPRPLPERSRTQIRAALLAAERRPERQRRFGSLALVAAAVLVVIALLVGAAVVLRVDGPPTVALPDWPTPSSVDYQIGISDAMVTAAIDPDKPGCSVAVVKHGDLVWSTSRGLADVATRRPLHSDSLFETAMSTRQFVASGALLLAGDGRLGLDQPVSQYVPGLPPWGGEVTVDHLIHHTSGIPDYYPALEAQGVSLSDRVTQTRAVTTIRSFSHLSAEPGQDFSFSNLSDDVLLAEVVTRAAGQPLNEVLTQRIFTPLALTMTVDPSLSSPRQAIPYVSDDAGKPHRVDIKWTTVGDRGLQASAIDLARWGDNYRTGAVGGPAMLQGQLAGAVDASVIGPGLRYAAGVFVFNSGALAIGGNWAGRFHVELSISADRTTVVAVTCNDPAVAERLENLRQVWIPGAF